MKQILVITFFSVFLAACGDNDAHKFVGQWIDPDPDEPISLFGGPGIEVDNDDVFIEDAGNNKVFVTVKVHGNDHKTTANIVKNSIVSESGKVRFEYKDGKLYYLAVGKLLDKKD